MRRDIINAPALQQIIKDALEGGPPALQDYRPLVRAYLQRVAEDHHSVKRARRRQSDPAWTHPKFMSGHTLYRFDESCSIRLFLTIREKLRACCAQLVSYPAALKKL